MSNIINVNIKVDFPNDMLVSDVVNVLDDADFKIAVHNTLAKFCDPYVPKDTGVLSNSILVTPEYLEYSSDYAHYMYEGQVYGPNFPIFDEDGVQIGWRSPPGKGSKHPTGRPLHYSVEGHPLATHHWDKAMMRDKGPEFTKTVQDLIVEFLRRRNSGS